MKRTVLIQRCTTRYDREQGCGVATFQMRPATRLERLLGRPRPGWRWVYERCGA